MKSFLLPLSFLFIFIALPAYAETPINNDSTIVGSAPITDTEDVAPVDFSDEGLDDEDLNSDLEAEALPTTDSFLYRWERFRNNIQSVFIFNAEKKAAHYRFRLHQLDRKLAACAEIGDEQCISKVEEHIQSLETRADKYIARRQELQERLLNKFDQWRASRSDRIEDLKERANERRDKKQELKKQREENRAEAKESRQKRHEELKQRLQERKEEIKDRQQDRQITTEQRQQNREHLIEVRSSAVKNKLDATRDQVEIRNQELEETLEKAE
jgi:chromosome segregation ATPase